MVLTGVYIALTYYFQSVLMALALLSLIFSAYWFQRSFAADQDGTGAAWRLKYAFPTIGAFFGSFALLGFAINPYFGGLVLAFEFGMVFAGFLFSLGG